MSEKAICNKDMSENAEHTPGPWSFDEDNQGVSFEPSWGLLDSRLSSLHVHVSSSASYDKEYTEKIAKANARLIAAAPETLAERDRLREVNKGLLEALEKLVGSEIYADGEGLYSVINGGLDDDDHRGIVKNAISAIAKAKEGKS